MTRLSYRKAMTSYWLVLELAFPSLSFQSKLDDCNELWPQFITDASVTRIIRGKQRMTERCRKGSWGSQARTMGPEQSGTRTVGNATRKGEELRPLPVKSEEWRRVREDEEHSALWQPVACPISIACTAHPILFTSVMNCGRSSLLTPL